jgi:tripartite motif-containing protein 71
LLSNLCQKSALFVVGALALCPSRLVADCVVPVQPSQVVYVISGTQILEFDESGNFKVKFGGTGTGPGQFLLPSGIVVSNDSGRVYVTDALLNRIQIFDACGKLLSPYGSTALQIGSTGTAPGFLYHPYGITVGEGGNLWVADTGNNRIQVFSQAGAFLFSMGGLGGGNGQFNAPTSLTFGNGLWVSDTGNNRIQLFNIAYGDPNSFAPTSATFVQKFGSYGNGNGQFRGPFGIVSDGPHVWVADSQNQRVQEFTSGGAFLGQISPFSYPSPYGITLDGAGIWTVDYNTNQVILYSPSGTKLLSFGSGPGLLYHPTYIAVGLISGYV